VTLIGYTMMCEQAGPKQLVRDVAIAEEAGFDFAVISDPHFVLQWDMNSTGSRQPSCVNRITV
jgi:alkanesulfonate monooxygenase SsuD/methylene tetrahydromethanopterin reductase-like flavin-dependent oxidoreductase (luciferase family)